MRVPDETQRISIIGRTGSGKTVAGVWHLSNAHFERMPYLIYDFKRDAMLAKIGDLEGAEHIDVDTVPSRPGLYFVHPHPDQHEEVQAQMWRIWEQEHTGVFVDEGYMVCGPSNQNSAFRSLLTQGRSKHIPMIILSQRPVWMDRFVFSESDFYQVFQLNHSGDRKKIMEYIPADLSRPLPKYHSYYHDVAENETFVVRPVPTEEDIMGVFDRKLDKVRKKKTGRVLL
jgi:hypothetical protein